MRSSCPGYSLHPSAQGDAWTFSEELLCIYTNTNGGWGWGRIAAVSLHWGLMGSVRYQPSQVWKLLVLLPAEAVNTASHSSSLKKGLHLVTDTSFAIVFSTAAIHIMILLFAHQENKWKCFLCVGCLFWFVSFSWGLGNGCRMKFNQEQYETREEFLEIQKFMYVLQALRLMLFIRKGHSMAKMFSFSPEMARAPGTWLQCRKPLQLPLEFHTNFNCWVVSAGSFFSWERLQRLLS